MIPRLTIAIPPINTIAVSAAASVPMRRAGSKGGSLTPASGTCEVFRERAEAQHRFYSLGRAESKLLLKQADIDTAALQLLQTFYRHLPFYGMLVNSAAVLGVCRPF